MSVTLRDKRDVVATREYKLSGAGCRRRPRCGHARYVVGPTVGTAQVDRDVSRSQRDEIRTTLGGSVVAASCARSVTTCQLTCPIAANLRRVRLGVRYSTKTTNASDCGHSPRPVRGPACLQVADTTGAVEQT